MNTEPNSQGVLDALTKALGLNQTVSLEERARLEAIKTRQSREAIALEAAKSRPPTPPADPTKYLRLTIVDTEQARASREYGFWLTQVYLEGGEGWGGSFEILVPQWVPAECQRSDGTFGCKELDAKIAAGAMSLEAAAGPEGKHLPLGDPNISWKWGRSLALTAHRALAAGNASFLPPAGLLAAADCVAQTQPKLASILRRLGAAEPEALSDSDVKFLSKNEGGSYVGRLATH